MKTKFLYFAMASCCLVTACNRSPSTQPAQDSPLGPDVLARVEGHAIRVADFEAELARRARASEMARAETREAVLRQMVILEATYLRAKEAGFDQRPEIVRQIKNFIADRFLEQQLKAEPESPAVTDAEVEAHYRLHADRFAVPERARFAVIQFSVSPKATPEKRAEALQRAEAVLAEVRVLYNSERTFGALAQRYSEDQATRYLGGDAGWLSRGEQGRWDKAVTEAAFALTKPGEVSPVIQAANAFWLVKLIEKQGAGRRPLEEVAEGIRYQLSLAKRHRQQDELHEAMTAGLKIEINRALLETISIPASRPHTTPPPLPGS